MPGYTFDLEHIFLGDLPLIFLGEIVFRTVVLYLFALAMMRLSGKRSSAQLTPVDVLIIVALGSSVGDPMFYADVPLLHGMVVIAVVILMRYIGVRLGDRFDRVRTWVEGGAVRLVADGRLDLEGLARSRLEHADVFEIVREKGYRQLGQIDRMYIEADGQVSVFPFATDEVRPGLAVEPPWDLEAPTIIGADTALEDSGDYACRRCGSTLHAKAGASLGACPVCRSRNWIGAAAD